MKTNSQVVWKRQCFPRVHATIVLVCLGLLLTMATGGQGAPPPAQVQEITGYLYPGEREVYDLPNLKRGDVLYVYMQHLSGNLDPLFAIADSHYNLRLFDEKLNSLLLKKPENPFRAFKNLLNSFYLAWDDDSGQGSDAALQFTIPADGDYKIVVAGSRQPVGRQVLGLTFGGYRLVIGLNSPAVLTGKAMSTGATIARLEEAPSSRPRIQIITGQLTSQDNDTYYRLDNIDAGTTLYVRAETTGGNLKPVLILKNYGNKVLQAENINGLQDNAQLQHHFKENAQNFTLHLSGSFEDSPRTSGSYRLLIGTNAPEVLMGKGKPTGSPLVRQPTKVRVGLEMDQITEVNQRGENFGAVGTLFLTWVDPDYAFNPDTCHCERKVFDSSQFEVFRAQQGLSWPRFIIYNQQGKRWSQAEFFSVHPDGEVKYYERFSATLQAPDFNFRRFPFDAQEFFIRLVCVSPIQNYVFENMPEMTKVGQQLGEEEWYITQHDTSVGTISFGNHKYSQFSFRFLAQRHLSYYIFRIFIPLLLIITVSWVTFFLKDYAKRVDISGANLLVFIAFNFTFGSDLPRLGYLTFLDAILIIAFIITALTVICNVALKRWDTAGKKDMIEKIDSYILWGYPILYATGILILVLLFFVFSSGHAPTIDIDFLG